MTSDWRSKAHATIERLCRVEYERANRLRSGKLRTKHVPYSVPDTARDLIEALNRDDEALAKSILMFRHDAQPKKES